MVNLILKTFCLCAFSFFSNFAHGSGVPEGLKNTYFAVKANKYGSLNSLSALRRLQSTVEGPVALLDIAKSPQAMYRTRFLGYYPPSPVSPGVVDKRPDFINKVGEVLDKSNKVQIWGLIRGDDTFDRGLTNTEKREVKEKLVQVLELYRSEDTSPHDKELISLVLSGYFNVDAEKGANESDVDLIEMNYLAQKISLSEKKILEGQGNILTEMKTNSDEIIKKVSANGKKVVEEASDQISKKIEQVRGNLNEEIASQGKLANSGLNNLQSGQKRMENRLTFIQDRLVSIEVQKDIYHERDPDKLDQLVYESKNCDDSVSRCRVLKKKVTQIQDRKDELIFEIKMTTTKNVASILANVGNLTDDPNIIKVAHTLDKVAYTVETVSKMKDLLSSAVTNGGMAAMGDVTSMVNLGVSLISAFGSSGPSPEQLILEQLMKIQEQIQELREEMHERFDILDQKIVDLGLSMDSQFQNVNANQLVLESNQQLITQLISNNSVAISNTTKVVREQAAGQKVDELQFYSNRIASTYDTNALEDAYFNLVSSFDAFLRIQPSFNLVWQDSKIEKDHAKSLQELVFNSLSGGSLNQIQWLDMLAQLSNYSFTALKNDNCRVGKGKILTLFNAFNLPLTEAFSQEFDDFKKVGAVSSNKFEHFLKTAPLELEFYNQLNGPFLAYTKAANNLQNCFQNFAKNEEENKMQSYMQYLIELYRKKVDQYFVSLGGLFSGGDLESSFLNAVDDPRSGLYADLETKFQSIKTERRGQLRFSQVGRFNSYNELKATMTREKIVAEMFPEIPHCTTDGKMLKVPSNLLTRNLPRHETWISLLLGLNKIDICYTWAGNLPNAGHITHVTVMKIRYHISGYPDEYTWHPTYTLQQDLHLKKGDIPGERKYRKEYKLLNPPSEETVEISVPYIEPDLSRIYSEFVMNDLILYHDPQCFGHKGYIYQCWPSDHDTEYVHYLPDVSLANKKPAYRDNFINLKKAEGVTEFDKLNAQEKDLRDYFNQTKEVLDNCRKNIALNNRHCEFGKIKALTNKQEKLEALSQEITSLNQLIRMSAQTMVTPAKGVSEAKLKAYMENFNLMMMSPTDIVQLVVLDSQGLDFQKSLVKTRGDLDEGFRYIENEWSKHMSVDLSWLTATESYLLLESQLLRQDAVQIK